MQSLNQPLAAPGSQVSRVGGVVIYFPWPLHMGDFGQLPEAGVAQLVEHRTLHSMTRVRILPGAQKTPVTNVVLTVIFRSPQIYYCAFFSFTHIPAQSMVKSNFLTLKATRKHLKFMQTKYRFHLSHTHVSNIFLVILQRQCA